MLSQELNSSIVTKSFWIPSFSIQIDSIKAPKQIIAILASMIAPGMLEVRFWFNSHLPFEGDLEGSSFRIRRIVRYGNPLRPIINGVVTKANGGTRILLKMDIPSPWAYLTFLLLSCLFVVPLFLSLLAGADFPLLFSLGALLMPPGIFLMWQICFWVEAAIASRILREALK
jgi:hypothetical protein